MSKFHVHAFLFVLVALAIWFVVAKTADYVVTTGTVVVTITLAWASYSRRGGPFVFLRAGLAIVATVALWFLAVDYSVFCTDCPGCFHRQRDAQYRVFGVPISTHVNDEPHVIQVTLSELGVPCAHDDRETWQRHRVWGLRFCDPSCFHGMDRLAFEPLSDEFVSKLRKLRVDNPGLAARLHHHAVREHDFKKFWLTLKDVTSTDDIYHP